MRNALHNSIHPPDMEINPPKTVCGYRCGVVVKTDHTDSNPMEKTVIPTILSPYGKTGHTDSLSPYGKTGHTDSPLTLRKNRSHGQSSHNMEKPVTQTTVSLPYGKPGHTGSPLTLLKKRPYQKFFHTTGEKKKNGHTDNPLTAIRKSR